jgi:hypothetical protein
MSELWAAVELMEGEPIVFVGVHAVKWQQEWGEPSVGFDRVDLDITVREDSRNSAHVELSVFDGGGLAGSLTVRPSTADLLLRLFGNSGGE